MPKLECILVPVDFSPCSLNALHYASFLAGQMGAAVDLLHVWEPPDEEGGASGSLYQFARSQAGREMEKFLGRLERDGVRQVHGRLESGDPCDIILDVMDEGYDLVVMGTHGHTGLSQLLHAGVAQRVTREASCPVVTVREGDWSEAWRERAARSGEMFEP
jgi:nucleotide-binding universal stress UspA family protein